MWLLGDRIRTNLKYLPPDNFHFGLWSFPLLQVFWHLCKLFLHCWSLSLIGALFSMREVSEQRLGLRFFFFFLFHLYSVDICNRWKINVSDVPVNVKNKAHFEGWNVKSCVFCASVGIFLQMLCGVGANLQVFRLVFQPCSH